jgi:aspartate aminotransferase
MHETEVLGAARLSQLQPSAVNAILAEVRAVTAQGRSVVSLMRGEPDFPTPPHIIDAAIAALRNGRTSYPDNRGEKKLREAVAAKLSREDGVGYDPESEILITDGATLGIHTALMTLVEPGDEVLLPDPIYDAYRSPIRLPGGEIRPVRSEIRDGRFELPLEALEEACSARARLLLLNTPWNPVGTVLTRREIERICDFVLRRNLLLISDEIYEHIVYDGAVHVSPASLSPEMRARCVLINSFSKTYAMTGWRLGYIAAPRDLISKMLLMLQQSSRGPATFVQDAGAAALDGPQNCVAEMRAAYAARRQQVAESLTGIAGVAALAPEGGFFAMVDVRGLGAASDAVRRRLLLDHGVAVAHGSAYGECGEGFLRVSFASGGETLARGLAKLREGLSAP